MACRVALPKPAPSAASSQTPRGLARGSGPRRLQLSAGGLPTAAEPNGAPLNPGTHRQRPPYRHLRTARPALRSEHISFHPAQPARGRICCPCHGGSAGANATHDNRVSARPRSEKPGTRASKSRWETGSSLRRAAASSEGTSWSLEVARVRSSTPVAAALTVPS